LSGVAARELDGLAAALARDLLARLDRAVPGRIEAFYVVGSAASGELRPGRSDLDFVATVPAEGLTARELRRMRRVHLGRWYTALARDVLVHRRWPLVCNGVYLRRGDVRRPPREVTPVAAHVAGRFRAETSEGFDVSPITWRALAERGIALRGPEPPQLGVLLDESEQRAWLLANLDGYWRAWTARVRRRRGVTAFPRRTAACGVLGVSRVHCTLATGQIASKPQAGLYALETFAASWRPSIEDALAYWEGRPPLPDRRGHPGRRLAEAAAFVEMVSDSAKSLARCENR
jgi:predicted nucleotidyltransferase